MKLYRENFTEAESKKEMQDFINKIKEIKKLQNENKRIYKHGDY